PRQSKPGPRFVVEAGICTETVMKSRTVSVAGYQSRQEFGGGKRQETGDGRNKAYGGNQAIKLQCVRILYLLTSVSCLLTSVRLTVVLSKFLKSRLLSPWQTIPTL